MVLQKSFDFLNSISYDYYKPLLKKIINIYLIKNSSIVFYLKPTFSMYFLQILQAQFSAFLIAFLNMSRPPVFL